MTKSPTTKNANRAKVYLKAAEYLAQGKSAFSCCAVDLAARHSPISQKWSKACDKYRRVFSQDNTDYFYSHMWDEGYEFSQRLLALCFMAAMVEAGDA